MPKNLISVAVFEKDSNRDVLCTWCYPSLAQPLKELLIRKCGLQETEDSPSPLYFHHGQLWYYLHAADSSPAILHHKVSRVAVALQTREFSPIKYGTLAQILAHSYSERGDPLRLLELFLSVLIRGYCSAHDNGTFYTKDFSNWRTSVPVSDVITTFGLESILIYTALLLKKRILVYHHKSEPLLKFLSAVPALAWHRQDWDVVWPHLEVSELQMLAAHSPHYLAGVHTAGLEARPQLYDLYVNLAAVELAVAPHAKELFAMSKTHKDIAVSMVRAANTAGCTQEFIIKEIAQKTKELLDYIKGITPDNSTLTLAHLQAANLAPALEAFLWHVAQAEAVSS